jgi:hypothetical protein
MRPHPAPKIRDEGLRGASKTMDDNLSAFGKIVEIVRPLLHHAPALGEVLSVIVSGANVVALVMGKLAFDPIGVKSHLVQKGGRDGTENGRIGHCHSCR